MVAIAKRLVSAHKISLLQREHFKATHDPLTGLINQIALDERIEHEISLGARYHKSFAVLMLEITHFQSFVQTSSKTTANTILIDFAKRIKNCVRSTDTVARFEGDIFVVLLPDVNDVRNVVKVIQSININLLSPFTINEKEFSLDASIGVSLFPGDGETKKQLIECAHVAMCQSKNDSNKNYAYYSPKVNDSVEQRIEIEGMIRRAIDQHEYDIHYMPIQKSKNDSLSYVQAEITWHKSELRNIGSYIVNKNIESLELGKLFGDITLNNICQQMAKWENDREYHGVPVLLELVQAQFEDGKLPGRFVSILNNHNVSPEALGFIIKESFLVKDLNFAIKQISALKQAGFKIVIDEFCSGLSYIGKLTDGLIDLVRLDSNMVAELDNKIEWLCVMEGIVRIAYHLKIDAIISGINDEHQYNIMQSISCDYWQGDYIYMLDNTEQLSFA